MLLILAASVGLFAQFATTDYVSQSRFWPTQTRYPSQEYAGSQACKGCHSQIFETQRETSMARTAMRAEESGILASHPKLSFANGDYHYQILNNGRVPEYTVSGGHKTESAPLAWAFGTNRVAQSYLFKQKDGEFYEARVTYFELLGALNFTPGRSLLNPVQDVEEAMDRQVSHAEVERCFSCHTTASGLEGRFDEKDLMPGLGCEACHGPGREHINDMEGLPPGSNALVHEANTAEKIFNPKLLTPEESVDFCGSCHGSYWDVSLSNSSGAGNARFQPYRLEQSKCWNKNDARLTCVACHDPHKEVQTEASAYDHVCLSCHLTKASPPHPAVADATHPGTVCPVATKNCSSCHMPQVYVAQMHASFPDHRIQILRPGQPFPD